MSQAPVSPTFGDKIFGAINANPLGFGASVLGAGFDIFNKISARDSARAFQNKQIQHSNRAAMQAWNDQEAARKQRIAFGRATRAKQLQIAHQYLLPQINRSANLAYESAHYANAQADTRDAFVRQNIMRQMLQNTGSMGSAGEGRARGFMRDINVGGGIQLGQMAEGRISRGYGLQSRLANVENQANQAITRVMAPLQMPLYEPKAASKPIMMSKMRKPANENLMIGIGSGLGMLGGFFGSNPYKSA